MPAAGFDVRRLFRLMEEAGADVLLASSRHNTRYLTGGYYYPLYAWDAHTRGTQYLSFLALPRDSLENAFFIGRPGEREALEEADLWLRRCHEAQAIGIRPAAAKAVEQLKAQGLDRGRIAVELPSLPAEAFRILAEGLPRAQLVDATPMLDALRAVKSAARNPDPARGDAEKPGGGGGGAHLGQGRGDHHAGGGQGRPGVRQAGAAFSVCPGVRRPGLLSDPLRAAVLEAGQPAAHRYRRHAGWLYRRNLPDGLPGPALGAGRAAAGRPAWSWNRRCFRPSGPAFPPRRCSAAETSSSGRIPWAATGSSSPTASVWCTTRTR